MFLLDSHCDAPLMLAKGADFTHRVKQGCTPGSFPVSQVDFPRMKKGGVNGSFFAIYTSCSLSPDAATHRALELVSRVYDVLEAGRNQAALATSPAQARRNARKGLISIFMGMENGAPIQHDLSLLRQFHRMGVRYLTLTHAGSNAICDSCTSPEPVWNGLSPFGVEVVEELNRLGMLVDVSHISDASFWHVLEVSKQPVVATHSCCRALSAHPRNMTDEMIRALAARGGVIQINFYPSFLDFDYGRRMSAAIDEQEDAQTAWYAAPDDPAAQARMQAAIKALAAVPRPSYKKVVDHIDHVVRLVGVEHVGIGSDFDGIEVAPDGLEDVGKMQKIIIELRRRGYPQRDINLIAGGNFLRVMEQVQSVD
ncbi:MAG: dipeptidase [Bacteroidales bacterium]|nr:dipeptidase [Bacteroidales bacterium]